MENIDAKVRLEILRKFRNKFQKNYRQLAEKDELNEADNMLNNI